MVFFMKSIKIIFDSICVYFVVLRRLMKGGPRYVLKRISEPLKFISGMGWINPDCYVKISFFVCRVMNKISFLILPDKYKSTCFIRAATTFHLSCCYNQKATLNIALPKNASILDLKKNERIGHCWTTINGIDYDSCVDFWIIIEKFDNNLDT